MGKCFICQCIRTPICAKSIMHKYPLVNFVQNDKKITIKNIEIHFLKEYNIVEI